MYVYLANYWSSNECENKALDFFLAFLVIKNSLQHQTSVKSVSYKYITCSILQMFSVAGKLLHIVPAPFHFTARLGYFPLERKFDPSESKT